jgi:addiction module RelE/StbE family toxin
MRILVVSNSAKRKIKIFIKKHPLLRTKLERVIAGLLNNPFLPKLETHKLTGRLKRLYAANITYEYRLVFFFDNEHVYIINIGSHDEVY